MNYYKVLLVDDEEEIRSGISRSIDWNELGFDLVFEASNGMDALEFLEQNKVDILLTDIQMPYMDGISLCKNLRLTQPKLKIIIFSGFDDFEYARRAIEFNASQYILKPINSSELREVLAKIKEELDFSKEKEINDDILRRKYEESLPILKQLFLTKLLDGGIKSEQIKYRAESYDISLPDGYWNVCFVSVQSDGYVEDEKLIFIKSLIENNMYADVLMRNIFLYNDKVAILTCLNKKEDIYFVLNEMQSVLSLANELILEQVSIGISRVHYEAMNISKCALEALEALDYRLISNSNLIYLDDYKEGTSSKIMFDDESNKKLVSAVKLSNEEEVFSVLDEVSKKLEGNIDLLSFKVFYLEITACLLKLTSESSLDVKEIFGENFKGTIDTSEFNDINELLIWCKECFRKLCMDYKEKRFDSNSRMIEQAKEYIKTNYADPMLNVEALCSFLHLSPAYFSTLFKKETGMSFISYLTDVRMGFAIEHLISSDEKTYFIAEKIGYVDPSYFGYVFKKKFGMSPSKYRLNLKASE